MVFWADDEHKKKVRIAEGLREKGKERRKEKLNPPPVEEAGMIEATVEDSVARDELAKQAAIISEKQEELKHMMVQQNKVLKILLERQDKPVYEIVNKPTAEQLRLQEEALDLPTLGEVDVKVINTEGIETQGKIGEGTKEGRSIRDSAAKLRAIKQRGKT